MKYQQYEVEFTKGKKGTTRENMVEVFIKGKYKSWLTFYHEDGTMVFDDMFCNQTLKKRIIAKCQKMLKN